MDLKTEFIHLLILGTCFLVLFTFGELLYHKFKWQGDNSRKVVHLVTGIITMAFPIYLQSWISVGLLCGGFLLILYFSKKYGFIKSINDVERTSHGSVIYPIIVFVLFLIYKYMDQHYQTGLLIFYVPLLIMAICDPLAAAVGKRFGKHKINYYDGKKSWEGAIAFAAAAFVIMLCLLSINNFGILQTLMIAIAVAVSTSIAEVFAKDGWDNFFIPITALLVYWSTSSYF